MMFSKFGIEEFHRNFSMYSSSVSNWTTLTETLQEDLHMLLRVSHAVFPKYLLMWQMFRTNVKEISKMRYAL
jgi:hypothetical protein